MAKHERTGGLLLCRGSEHYVPTYEGIIRSPSVTNKAEQQNMPPQHQALNLWWQCVANSSHFIAMSNKRKIIVNLATSADGYIARPDGDIELLKRRVAPKGFYGLSKFE